ncbi:MAG: dienelactone hydrolase family protein [Candidatus Hydrogenedentes bacterium]|nr:dienelactone hydrolase family protein [Candidatus Hydrogenedentota bacterium]
MTRRQKILSSFAGTVLVVIIVVQAAKIRLDSHYYDGYDASLPLNPVVQPDEERSAYTRTAFSFDGLAGMRVPTLMARPKGAPGPFPCVIFLHGIGQKKEFLDEIAPGFVEAGFALVSSDQYTRGERKLPKSSRLDEILALRRRAALTVIETRRLVDYLQTRPDIYPDRIYLAGASFGAITGSTAAAFEPRIQAVVLTYGGGNLPVLLNSKQAAAQVGPLIHLAKYAGAYLFAPSDPILHVREISPRPILFQSGADDTLVPPASGRALFDAAYGPKDITWYPGDHVGLDPVTTKLVLAECVSWLKSQDATVVLTAAEKKAK